MAANQRPDRDELTARLRKFGISDALCDRVHDEGVEAVLKAPKGPKKKDPVAGAREDEAAKNVQPKHRKSALDALSRPKMARGLLESYSGTDATEFRYWKGVELKRRSAKETAKRASNESWTLKKRKELRAWKAERDALARRCKETKAAMEKKTKAYRREMDRYVEVKGEEDLKERMLSESLRRKPTSRAGDRKSHT